jgi:hypothetical protein
MNSTRVLFYTQCTFSMPSWQRYIEILKDYAFCYVLLCTVSNSKVFNNLEDSP